MNSVGPGEIATAMTGQEDQDPAGRRRPGVPLGRPGDAREIAEVVAFLCGPGAGYVTGATWLADGGMSLTGPSPARPCMTTRGGTRRRAEIRRGSVALVVPAGHSLGVGSRDRHRHHGGMPPRVLPERADVVVVGGGVMGASTAFHLAEAGVGVVAPRTGVPGGRVDVQGGRRGARPVLRPAQHRARRARARGLRPVRGAAGPGDRLAPQRLPLPPDPAGRRRRVRGGRRAAERPRACRAACSRRRRPPRWPRAADGRRARRRLPRRRRLLLARVRGARLRGRCPPARGGGAHPRGGARSRRGGLRRRRRPDLARDGHGGRGGLRGGGLVGRGRCDGRRRPAGDAAAPPDPRDRAAAGGAGGRAAGVHAHDDRRGVHVLPAPGGPRRAAGDVMAGRAAGFPAGRRRRVAPRPDRPRSNGAPRGCSTSGSPPPGRACTR